MATLIEQFQSEDVSRDLKQMAGRLDQISDQRVKQLAGLANLQLDETANAEGFVDRLDNTSADQIKTQNRNKIRAFARQQWRSDEVVHLSQYVIRGSVNQSQTPAEVLDRLIHKIAFDTGSDFATLMAAITAANTARTA